MTDARKLTRRGLVASGSALAMRPAPAVADDRQRFMVGKTTFAVPKAFLFDDVLPPGTSTEGLPPTFSFAFLAPSGTPAGEGLQFPARDQPLKLERENGQTLVVCSRVTSSVTGSPGSAPRDQLANRIMPTAKYLYSDEEHALVIRSRSDLEENRYVSLIDERNLSGVQTFLTRIASAQFFSGTAQFEKCRVRTSILVSQARHSTIGDIIVLTSQLLSSWAEA